MDFKWKIKLPHRNQPPKPHHMKEKLHHKRIMHVVSCIRWFCNVVIVEKWVHFWAQQPRQRRRRQFHISFFCSLWFPSSVLFKLNCFHSEWIRAAVYNERLSWKIVNDNETTFFFCLNGKFLCALMLFLQLFPNGEFCSLFLWDGKLNVVEMVQSY